ncbi:MAG: GNAT family N-acetyltransferase [Halanaerobiales bacterium]
MEVYNIQEKDLNKFILSANDNPDLKRTVESLWKDGFSKPAWCFVLEEEKIIGRIGYWASPDNKREVRIFGLLLPWEREDLLTIGEKILTESLQKMKKQGAKYVNYQIHTEEDKPVDTLKQIFKLAGMKQIQAKKRYKLSKKTYESIAKNRLNYKSLKEVGKDLFIEVIKKVTRGTLDKEDELSVSNLGEQKDAKNHLNNLKDIDFSPPNWFVGYKNKEIVGLVVPQKLNKELGTINYIGVVPEKRGHGYVIDLLDKGIKNLFNRNIFNIIADIDRSNFPMENALLKLGFKDEKEIFVNRLVL